MSGNLENLRKLANGAARVIREVLDKYGEDAAKNVQIGAYGSPSSLVDVRAETSIIEMVREEDMPYNIFTEEAGSIDRGYEKTIIVDPLDGSYNAEHGIPYFAVSIALAKKGLRDVEYGIVKNVATGDEYYAILGKGAYKNGKKLNVRGDRDLYVIYLGKKAHEKALEIARNVRRVRAIGSASLEMCMVAEGIADLFIYLFKDKGVLRIVDIAAAYLIVKEAGGIVVDGNFNPLDMDMNIYERRNIIAGAKIKNLEILK